MKLKERKEIRKAESERELRKSTDGKSQKNSQIEITWSKECLYVWL